MTMAMRRLLLALLLLVCSSGPAFARGRLNFWCQNGGVTVQIPGTQGSSTKFQQSYPGCTATIYLTGTTTLASIYSDNAGTPKANPFTVSSSSGQGFSYSDAGRYDLKLSGTGISAPFTISDIVIVDNAQVTPNINAITYTATPTFDASLYTIFAMTLTGNVTSSTITNSPTIAGQTQIIGFNLCQDATGSRTFSWPASFLRPPTVSPLPSTCTNASFLWDGTNWRALAATGDTLAATNAVFTGPLVVLSGASATDDCATINAAARTFTASGGTIDARAMVGTRTCLTNPFTGVTAPINFLTSAATFPASTKWTYMTGFKWLAQGTTLSQNFTGDFLMQEASITAGNDDLDISGVKFSGLGTTTGYALLHIRGQRYRIHHNWFLDTGSQAQNTTVQLRIEGCASNGVPTGCTGALAVNDGIVSDNVFSDTRWIAISAATNVGYTVVKGNVFDNTFAFLDWNGDSFDSPGLSFTGNTVKGGGSNSALQSVTNANVTGNTISGQTAGVVANSGVLNITAVSNNLKGLVISSNNIVAPAESCLSILNNVSYFSIVGNVCDRPGKDGFSFNLSSPNVVARGVIVGNQIRNCSTTSAGTYSAIRFILPGTASAQNIAIDGNETYDDQGTQTCAYGLANTGAGTFVGITGHGNDFSNMKLGGVNFAIAPTQSSFFNKEDATNAIYWRNSSILPVNSSGFGSTSFATSVVTNGLTPFSAGGDTVGSAALPYSKIFIGAAATNNIGLTGTATSVKTATLPDNTGTVAELNLAQSFTAAQGFSAITNATGIQGFNTTTTCTTGATIGATCTTAAIAIPVTYADTNYRMHCVGLGATNVPVVITVVKSNTTFTIAIAALTAAAATFSSYDCIAVHN